MKRRYYIRAESGCIWKEIDGTEFYQLINSPEGKDRHFARLEDITIEAPKSLCEEWEQQDRHSAYLKAQTEGWREIPLYSGGNEEYENDEEALIDQTVDVEGQALRNAEKKAHRAALSLLDTASYQLIYALYLAERRKSEYELAREYGVSQNAIHKRKKKILKILKNLVVKG